MKRADIVASARKWIDTPFLHQGRNENGIDCVGLIQKVGDDFNILYTDLKGYARAPTDVTFLRHLRIHLSRTSITGNRIGMVGVFRQSIYPCHIGIFANDDKGRLTVINARADRHRVVEEIYKEGPPPDFWLVELLSFPGLED